MKFLQFASLAVSRPSEAYGRLEGIVDSRVEPLWVSPGRYHGKAFDDVIAEISSALRRDLTELLVEPELKEIEGEISRGVEELPPDAPFGMFQNGDMNLARLCYVLTRAMQPETVLETGVCYGVTTSFLLQALRVNGFGKLYSIDLPPLGNNALDFVGKLVPDRLRDAWFLHRGPSRLLLPALLKSVGFVGLFVHDSLHTYRNIRRELHTVTPLLAPMAAVLADDIEGNSAFAQWASRVKPNWCGIVKETAKQSLLGVGLLLNQSQVALTDPKINKHEVFSA